MEMIIENWYMVVALLALGVAAGICAGQFIKLPTGEQLAKVQSWLLLAVSEAERELGGGTGELKLRRVYDRFLSKFPWLARVVSFKRFEDMVKKALKEMAEMLADNQKAREYVEGE